MGFSCLIVNNQKQVQKTLPQRRGDAETQSFLGLTAPAAQLIILKVFSASPRLCGESFFIYSGRVQRHMPTKVYSFNLTLSSPSST